MTDSIRFSVTSGDDGTCQFTCHISSGGYAGVGSAYFNIGQVEEFAERLLVYPLPQSPIVLAGGIFDEIQPDLLTQEHLFIEARFVVNGPVGVFVRVAEQWDTMQALRRSASADFRMDYEQLGSLCRKLKMLVSGDRDSVVIDLGASASC